MNTKTLLAGLVGGVVAFLLGWLLYGILLQSWMLENTNQCASRGAMENMLMWAMILSNLLMGFLYAFILGWAGVTSFMGGLTKGAIVGLLVSAGFDLNIYSMSTYFSSMNAVCVDVVMGTIYSALIAGVVGWMLGRGKAAAA